MGGKTLSIFYTVHPKDAWIEFQKVGYLIGSKKHVWDEFLEPYHWMMKQMAKRLPRYEGNIPSGFILSFLTITDTPWKKDWNVSYWR